MLNEDIEELKEMLEKKQIVKLREKINSMNETNIAECI